ncbi:MAG TPA: hypothetical protein VNJ54_08305 [Plantibacter sp.]|uniref:hypothetical protein n=1 Tax=unclassified Plantibacter TaxID=2624265 RepID=UPI002CB198E8|nr:hypothetical protein [Plantibacter sp.]
MSSSTMTGDTTSHGRGPLPQGDAARLLAAGAIPVFASLPSLVTAFDELNAAPLFLIGPAGILIAAAVIWVSARNARVPAEWLDSGNTTLRVLGAILTVLGLLVFLVSLWTVPQWSIMLWLLVPATSAIGTWLSFLGAKRIRPDALAS